MVTLPVIPKICPLCTQQTLGKPASLYWAWTRSDGRRKAWKQKVCADCFREHYVKLIIASMEPVLICPACGISTVDDYDAVYLTYCLPGMPKDQSEMPMCGPCAVSLRNKALEGAREWTLRSTDDVELCGPCAVAVRNTAMEGASALEDREVGVGGPQPVAQSASQAWADLGLRPR